MLEPTSKGANEEPEPLEDNDSFDNGGSPDEDPFGPVSNNDYQDIENKLQRSGGPPPHQNPGEVQVTSQEVMVTPIMIQTMTNKTCQMMICHLEMMSCSNINIIVPS
jgi:hypothetical protein